MSLTTAKKLIEELQTNEELRAKTEGITDPAEMVKKAVEAGYDVTLEEMLNAEREYRAEQAAKTDEQSIELTADELESVAGGQLFIGDNAPDGSEIGCIACYHGKQYSIENDVWCTGSWIEDGHRDYVMIKDKLEMVYACYRNYVDTYGNQHVKILCKDSYVKTQAPDYMEMYYLL